MDRFIRRQGCFPRGRGGFAALLAGFLFVCVAAPALAAQNRYARGNFVETARIVPDGTVRAEVVGDVSELLGGPKRDGRVGDFKLHNGRVGFVIAGIRPSSGITTFGGVVEEAGFLRREDGGARWYNLMGDVMLAFYKGSDPLIGSRIFAPVTAEIIKDGKDGEAVVRFTGRDADLPLRAEILRRAGKPLGTEITVDYVLRADSNVLETRITVKNTSDENKLNVSVAQMFLIGDGAKQFFPGAGFDPASAKGAEFTHTAAFGGGVSYSWFPANGKVKFIQKIDAMLFMDFGKIRAEAGGESSMGIYMAVGDGGLSTAAEAFFNTFGFPDFGYAEGKVMSGGEAAADVFVHALTPEGGYVSNSPVGEDGKFRIALPSGDYMLQAAAQDRTEPAAVQVVVKPGEATAANIEIESPGRLSYSITDEKGESIPVTISFKRLDDATRGFADERGIATEIYGGGFFKVHFAATGTGEVTVRPGVYNVYFTRGLEYEYIRKRIEFKAGETAVENEVSLTRSVDTTGFLSGDFHIHAQPSHDSNDIIYDKVSGIAAAGIEIPIATDHDVNTDYAPYIEALGLGKLVKSIIGDEITTKRLGHFNAFPLAFDSRLKNWGAIDWMGKRAPEIFDEVHNGSAAPSVVQLNHPRSPSMGYLNSVNYEPASGTAVDKDNFSFNFDAMEVLNGDTFTEMVKSRADWYSFLNRGRRVVGVGNSDNHNVFGIAVGYPRNFIASRTDTPGEATERELIDAILAGKITVCGGAFININVDGRGGIGDTVSLSGGQGMLNIVVQAPSWVETKTLTITANGEDIQTIELVGGEEVVRFNGAVPISPERDTWYVVRVEGEKKIYPVYPGSLPYSFTNPVYVDADGNGVFDAPMETQER